MSKINFFLATILFGVVAATVAGHATVVVDTDGSGNLTGAQNVDVNGTFYDVQFEDGSCATLFNGCTSTSDFPFHNQSDAVTAAQALLDQVVPGFLPYQVTGCNFAFECQIYIPYDVDSSGMDYGLLDYTTFLPGFFPPPSVGSGSGIATNFDTTNTTGGVDDLTFAVFTPAPVATPEPASFILLSAGLAGLVSVRRKRRE